MIGKKIITYEEVDEFLDDVADLYEDHHFIVDETFYIGDIGIYGNAFYLRDGVSDVDESIVFGFDFVYELIDKDTLHITRPDDGMVWKLRRLKKNESKEW